MTHQPSVTWDYEYTPYRLQYLDDTHPDGELPHYRIYAESDPEICIAETNEDLAGDVQEAHARLIAAAPELLSALRHFFNIMHDYECSVRKGYVTDAMRQSREAILKATGGVL